ncbi:MAG: hypothetical protein BWX69_01305 [Planctomycetes bacterium ADurb.Bin069]|nr:MAG: hypothetical protein BWX69_01305 [Planctomycetes bacterium ADurb.Bin069]
MHVIRTDTSYSKQFKFIKRENSFYRQRCRYHKKGGLLVIRACT